MRRVEKGFSGVETPLFEGMLVPGENVEEDIAEKRVQDDDVVVVVQEGVVAAVVEDTRVKKLEKANKVKTLKLRRLRKVGTSQRIESSNDTNMENASKQGRMIHELDRDEGIALMDDEGEEKKTKDAQVVDDEQVKGRQADIYQIDMDHAAKVLSMQEDEPEVQEAVEVVTTAKLITEVVAAVSESVSAASVNIVVVPAATIIVAPVKVAAASTRRRKGVVIRDLEEESIAKIPYETNAAAVVQDDVQAALVNAAAVVTTAAPVKVAVPYTRRRRGVVIRDPEEESSAKTPIETKLKDKGKEVVAAVSESVSAASVNTVAVPAATIIVAPVKVVVASTRRRKGVGMLVPGENVEEDIAEERVQDDVVVVVQEGVVAAVVEDTRVKKLEKANKVKTLKLRRLRKVGTSQRIESSDDTNMENASKQGRMIPELDRDEGIALMDDEGEENKTKDAQVVDDEQEKIKEEENRALESINETPAQKAAKRRRLNEEVKDVEEIKQHLEIVPDEDDDVYTEATPLARKYQPKVVHYSVNKVGGFYEGNKVKKGGNNVANNQKKIGDNLKSTNRQNKKKGHDGLDVNGVNASKNNNDNKLSMLADGVTKKVQEDCINEVEIEDVYSSGLFYTWIKSPFKLSTSILKTLDEIMVNEAFIAANPNAFAIFLPYLVSDHSPSVLCVPKGIVKKFAHFRFANYVIEKKEFLITVEQN
nr:RNA-directed DNA polymerase, eukaryota, reverse transcriptase zinc-binding domain protein [Tanacetum cinerariifolium]